MSGTVKQFVDFSSNVNDSDQNNAASIQPIVNGEGVDQTVLQRPSENLRQRTEALRNADSDTLYLRDADRALIITGPGAVTWPGSTTAAQTGIPVLTNTLYVLPMLTPGFAQTPPVPPVASAFGVIHLKRASDSMDSILVTSMRRSYAGGDQINITVTPGAVFSCTLEASSGLQRTIKIVATGATQLSTVITALNGLLPSAPDNTQLVNAALEGGALGTDLLLTSQAKQYMVGNYDGEGHAITPANLAAFFTGNPGSALAEGDTLCVQYDMVTDTASTGGRRQAIPENSNTVVPVGAFFNSRVNPEKLVNALPLCKVVNGALVFGTGCEVPQGATAFGLASASSTFVSYAGGGNWADGTTNPATTVEGQLDKIISDLAGATGTGKIQGSALGSELAVGTLAAQLASIVRRSLGWITIGNGTTVVGDFNTSDYPDANALLTAAIAALPANGGTIVLKKGTPLSGFAATTVALPAGKTVEILGDHSTLPSSTPHLTFAATERLVCSGTGKLVLRNLHIRHAATAVTLTTAPCEVYDVFMESTATTDAGAAFQGVNVSDLKMRNVTMATVLTTASANAMFVRVTGIGRRIHIDGLVHTVDTGTYQTSGGISIADMRHDVVLENISSYVTAGLASGAGSFIVINTTDNTTEIWNRKIRRVTCSLTDLQAVVRNDSVGHIDIEDVQLVASGSTSYLFFSSSYSGTGPVRIRRCKDAPGVLGVFMLGSYPDLIIEQCDFYGTSVGIGQFGTATHGDIIFRENFFHGQNSGNFWGIGCSTAVSIILDGNRWNPVRTGVLTNSVTGFCFNIAAQNTIEDVRIVNNTVENFFNIVYGAPNTNWPNLFAVKANYVNNVACNDNQLLHISNFSSGAAHRAGNVLAVSSSNGTSNASVQWGSITMEGNVVGDPDSIVSLFALGLIVPWVIKIHDNVVTSRWSSTAGTAQVHDWIQVIYGTNFSNTDLLSITDNDFRIINSSLTQITEDWLAYTAITVFAKCVAIQNNHLSMNHAATDFAVGMSFVIVVNGIIAFALQGNLFERNVASPSYWFKTSFSNNPLLTLPAGGPPAPVTAWSDNLTIHSL
jgi:hypothetical protein